MPSSSGLLNVFEDFCPQSDECALLVTGQDYMHHTELREARYHLEGERVVIEESRLLREGEHLRLGNVYDGKVVFSDAGAIEGAGEVTFDGYAEQPFRTDEGLFYTQDSEVWFNGQCLIASFDGYDEVGHPTVHGRWVYFEAKRQDPAAPGSALDWQLLRYHLDRRHIELVLEHGANPYVWGSRLFHSRWSEELAAFETAAVALT